MSFPLVRAVRGNLLRSRVRRFESCWGALLGALCWGAFLTNVTAVGALLEALLDDLPGSPIAGLR